MTAELLSLPAGIPIDPGRVLFSSEFYTRHGTPYGAMRPT
jgi:hypothetical protein